MRYGWRFPVNSENGEKEAFNSHGIEHFQKNSYSHLVRETIQNSLDAKDEDKDKVVVEYKPRIIKTNDIPDVENLRRVFETCANEKVMQDKARSFFRNGLDILSADKINTMLISDYNTTGLLGVETNSDNWRDLTSTDGGSYKPDGSGGSFGIGKNAPFALSHLHTIFYSTLTSEINENRGMMGVSKLSSHMNSNKEETRGVGYYRNLNDNKSPFKDLENTLSLFQRSKPGTDILILGVREIDNWKDTMVKEVLQNYFITILNKKLEVMIDDIKINDKTIAKLMKEMQEKDPKFSGADYYEAYNNQSENCRRKKAEIGDLGHLEISIFLDNSPNRKVLMARDQGMTVKYLSHFPAGIYFTGVMTAKGKKLNELLRLSEPPTHDDWNVDYYRGGEFKKAKVKKVIKKINKIIRDFVSELNKENEKDSIDIEGVGDLLGTDSEEKLKTTDVEMDENYTGNIVEVKIAERKSGKSFRRIVNRKGTHTKKPKIHPLPRESKRKKKKQDSSKKTRSTSKKRQAKIERIRTLGDFSKGSYKVKIFPSTNGVARLSINQIGENNRKYSHAITNIIDSETGQAIYFEKGVTEDIKFRADKMKEVEIQMENNYLSRLEVIVHEN